MTLIKRGDVWHFEFLHDGQRYRGTTKCTRKADARQVEAAVRDRAMRRAVGLPTAGSSMTFEELATMYVAWSRKNKKSWQRDISTTKNLCLYFGTKQIDAITPIMVENYRERRRDGRLMLPGKHTPPMEATINRELAALRAIYNKARQWRVTESNPMAGVTLNIKAERSRLEYLTAKEVPRLLAACSARFRPLVQAAIETGCRQGELLALRWKDIDFTAGVLYIGDSKSGEGRAVRLSESMINTLQEIRPSVVGSGTPVFINHDGSPYRDLRYAWDVAMKDSGLAAERAAAGRPALRFHDLRHTHATILLTETNGDLDLVRRSLGHKTAAMTMRYAHLVDSRYQNGVDAVAAAIAPEKSPQNPPQLKSRTPRGWTVKSKKARNKSSI